MTTTTSKTSTSKTAGVAPEKLLDGKAVAAEIRDEVKQEVAALVDGGHRPPGLTAVLVGGNPASQVYVNSKARACEEVGMVGNVVELDGDISQDELDATVDDLNADPAVDGILVQLPLPYQLTEREILDRIDPEKDVDGFHPVNVGRLWLDLPGFVPATPSGIVELLQRRGVELKGKHAVIVGRSAIVGKPMAALFLRQHATVTVCHSRTKNLAAVCRQADVLVAAVGRTGIITPDHVKDGAVVVDVGMNRLTTKEEVEHYFPGDEHRMDVFERRGSTLVGDVDFTRVAPKASLITPVPGGVGPLTIALLLVNTLEAARRRQGLA